MESKFEKFLRMILDESIFKPVSTSEQKERNKIFNFKLRQVSRWETLANNNDIYQMKQMLDDGFDINDDSYDHTALEIALEKGYGEMASFLLSYPQVKYDKSILFTVLNFLENEEGDNLNMEMEQFFKQLIYRDDMDVNARDGLNRTILEIAINYGLWHIVEMMVKHPKTDLKALTRFGNTFMEYAIYMADITSLDYVHWYKKIIDILEKHGVK
jgi:ankyrin repeat protein